MSLEKMKLVEEVPQNDNDEINNNESLSKGIPENNYSNIYAKNNLHIIGNAIINLALMTIIIIEFIIRGKNDYFIAHYDFLITIFAIFQWIFIVGNFISSNNNLIKGVVYYPFVNCYWGIADFLSLFILNNMHNWNIADTLKIVKFSLIGLNVLINIVYIIFCKNK